MTHLPCGHRVANMDEAVFITIKDQAKDGSKATSYMPVCYKCFDWYLDEGVVLSEAQADKYLLGGDDDG